jgi:hypothetical protein
VLEHVGQDLLSLLLAHLYRYLRFLKNEFLYGTIAIIFSYFGAEKNCSVSLDMSLNDVGIDGLV